MKNENNNLPVAFLLRFTPSKIGGEQFVVCENVPAITLTPGLLRTVSEVRLKGLLHLRESLAHVLYTGWLFVFAHISHEGKQTVSPETDVRRQNFSYVGEQLFCIYLF